MKALGDVVLKTNGRVIGDQEGFFSRDIMQLYQNEEWRNEWLNRDEQLFIAPFCYVPFEIEIPF